MHGEFVVLHTINKKQYVAYRIVTIPMTLSDLQGHSLLQTFSNVTFS